jgi:hypothetical protein
MGGQMRYISGGNRDFLLALVIGLEKQYLGTQLFTAMNGRDGVAAPAFLSCQTFSRPLHSGI